MTTKCSGTGWSSTTRCTRGAARRRRRVIRLPRQGREELLLEPDICNRTNPARSKSWSVARRGFPNLVACRHAELRRAGRPDCRHAPYPGPGAAMDFGEPVSLRAELLQGTSKN